ncbi:MAG TPA: hypothetical protein VLF94_02330 [Chlamydiales bacterium]|nr:hypothetical protein [Chlamydiales bacterium]
MKKFAMALAVFATLMGNVGHAQGATNKMGGAAKSGGTYSEETFAWGIGLGMLVVLGVVVGVTAGYASSSPSTSFGH